MRSATIALVSFAASLYGQTFDAASVKPAAPPGRGVMMQPPSGGPGTKDPGRIHYPFVSLGNLLMTAYDAKNFQISGPDWLFSTRFDITATMPPETTKEQFHVMLQNLLAERFKLTLHRETKELPMYSLVVAKSGLKMKESAPAAAPKDDAEPVAAPPLPMQPKMGPDGFPVLPPRPPGLPIIMISMNGKSRFEGQGNTTQELADRLTSVTSRPVTDDTGLKGKYDFTVTFAPEGMNGPGSPMPAVNGASGAGTPDSELLPDIFGAVQAQLGLRLESKKGPVAMIVIDHIEKTPIEN